MFTYSHIDLNDAHDLFVRAFSRACDNVNIARNACDARHISHAYDRCSKMFKSKFVKFNIVNGVVESFVDYDGRETRVGIVDPRTWSRNKCADKVSAYLISRNVVEKRELSHVDVNSYFDFAHKSKHDIKTMRAIVTTIARNVAKSNDRANARAQRAQRAIAKNDVVASHDVDVNDVDASRIVETFDAIANDATS
jgi:hypothetical protein